jgi:hypothetical protein
LTGINSPTGEVLFTPTTVPTETSAYVFEGVWMDWTDNNKEYY